MKKFKQGLIAALAVSFIAATPAFAIEGLKLQIHCPDVVLSWPSVEGENYIVQHRETLSTNTPWVTLTNYLPAEIGTNMTFFVHSNRVDCPAGQVFGMMLSSGGESTMMKSATLSLSAEERTQIKQAREEVRLIELYQKCELEGRQPYEWELKNHPPLPPTPEEIRAKILKARDSKVATLSGAAIQGSALLIEGESLGGPFEIGGGNDPQPESGGGGGGSEPTTGFYQVVRDGVYVVSVTNLTNGVLSGTLPILIEAGNADYSNGDVKGTLNCATLLIDGENFAGDGTIGAPPAYPWQFTMDTGFLENGEHTVQVQVSWKNPDNTDNNYQTLSRWSNPISITVSNAVNYPGWVSEVGEANISAFYLQTVHTDAFWQILITDVNSNHVQTLSGYATNGVIEAYWDLVDTNGVARTNATTNPTFNSQTVVQATGGGTVTKKNPPKKHRSKDWPEHGKWVVAYQDYFKFEYSANNAKKGSINNFALTAGKYGGYVLYYPQPGQTNDIGQTYPLRYQKDNHFDPSITFDAEFKDRQMLRTFLANTNSRNFYFDGHGTPKEIAGIDSEFLKLIISHRYRFVFLNACNTANGDLPQAFGITEAKRNDIGYYQKTGIRPAAFVGYSTAVTYAVGGAVVHGGVTYDDTIPFQVPGFINNFLFFWDPSTYGFGLLSSINSAKSGLPPVNNQYREDYLTIRGYFNLGIDAYNRQTDTW